MWSAVANRVINTVIKVMQIESVIMKCWTDSTIVLAWIKGHPSRLNIFVANSITEIQKSFPIEIQRHVVSEDNPADCATRGVEPDIFHRHPLWWTGHVQRKAQCKLPVRKLKSRLLPSTLSPKLGL